MMNACLRPLSLSGFACTLAVLAIVLIPACGPSSKKKPVETVTGQVTFQSKPVTEGQVTFLAEDGASATADLDSSGKFTIEELPIGKYVVSVTPPALTEAPTEDPNKMPPPKKYPNIPEGYRSEVTSDLTAEVHEGEDNNFTFDMKPGGGKKMPTEQEAP